MLCHAGELGVSSLHVTFPTGEEWSALGSMGFQQRRGIQYHWENRGYDTFDGFLADLKQRKRKSIRQVCLTRECVFTRELRPGDARGCKGVDTVMAWLKPEQQAQVDVWGRGHAYGCVRVCVVGGGHQSRCSWCGAQHVAQRDWLQTSESGACMRRPCTVLVVC